jgi:hypothetical protein
VSITLSCLCLEILFSFSLLLSPRCIFFSVSHLGGDDFDKAIIDWILNDSRCISKAAVQHIRKNILLFNLVRNAAVRAKTELSEKRSTTIFVSYVYKQESINVELTRDQFDLLTEPLIRRMLDPLRKLAIITEINLPGDSGKPNNEDMTYEEERDLEREMSDELTAVTDDEKGEKSKLLKSSNIDLIDIAAMGLKQLEGRRRAVEKRKLQRQTKPIRMQMAKMRQIDPLSKLFPGGQGLSDVLLVGGATRMPSVIAMIHKLTGINPKRYLNPDEAIALGAGIYAGKLDGTIDCLKIINQGEAAFMKMLNDNPQAMKDWKAFVERSNAGILESTEDKGKDSKKRLLSLLSSKRQKTKLSQTGSDAKTEELTTKKKSLSSGSNNTKLPLKGKTKSIFKNL